MSINTGYMPANPLRGADNCVFKKTDASYFDSITIGLTKREAFAMAAMQGLSCTAILDDQQSIDGTIEMSVRLADALLKELSK